MITREERWAQIQEAAAADDRSRARALILEGLQADPALVGDGRHVDLANILLRAADWPLIDLLLPAGTNFFRSSGWLESLRRGVPADARGEPLPWLTYPAIDFLEPRIGRDWSVFEWGCGASTLWWAKRAARVRAVDDNAAWVRRVSEGKPDNCQVELATSKESYVGALEAGGPYDVVTIDGSWRNECAAACAPHKARIIIFDNSDLQAHDPGLTALMAAGWQRLDFFGLIPSYAYKNCTSLFFKDASVLAGPLPSRCRLSAGATCSQAMGQ